MRPTRAVLPLCFLTLSLAAILGACGTPDPPDGGTAPGLSIAYPVPNQTLAGTFGLAAAGGGSATGLQFELGAVTVDARADGTAYLDTRGVPDGAHTLRARATVGGKAVEAAIPVVVANDVASSASVGADGGTLKTARGSFAAIPPGALAGGTTVTVTDETQAGILAEYGVDYAALGVNFLGALEIDTSGATVDLPVTVDLAGWASAVQPGQQVVMFALAPDADGDGIGELTFASNAEATDTGSVITRPTPKSEVYGFGAAGTLGVQQAGAVKPGQILTLSGRGFNVDAPLSNVARYGSAASPTAETLIHTTITGSGGFNPLLQIQLAVPALGAGGRSVMLHNLTTGYRTDPIALDVAPAGTATDGTWTAFVEQVATAAERLTSERADLAAVAATWVAVLGAESGSVAAAMAGNSGLVGSAQQQTLAGITAGHLSAAERDLVGRHALVLDAIAASAPAVETATAAADLATLLVTTSVGGSGAPSAASGLAPQQGGGSACSGAAAPPTAISWGGPVTTGMGSAPPGSCASGNGSGPNGPAPLSAARLGPAALATTSLRGGTFQPVPGAVLAIYRQGTNQRLAPFTAIADATGFFTIPFVPPGEPFTVRAIDPNTGNTASADGVAAAANVTTPVQLIYSASVSGPGSPVARFTITPIADADFAGTVYYAFDAAASSDDGEIVEYVWDFDGFSKSLGDASTVRRGFGRNGSYTIRLTVLDDDGNFGIAQQVLDIDDLPYDYWGQPPVQADILANGSAHGGEAENRAFAMSADGRYVAFSTGSTGGVNDLLPPDANGLRDVYRKDLTTGALALVSAGADGVETGFEGVSISADGRKVAYMARPTADGGRWSLHVRDMASTSVETIAVADTHLETTAASLSADGASLLYYRHYSLTDPTAEGGYVRDLTTGSDRRLGGPETGGATTVRPVALTPSGAHALVGGGYGELFVIELDTSTVTRVDVNADGVAADKPAEAGGAAISADGRYVTFLSEATNLVADPPEPFIEHVYLKDLETGAIVRVSRNEATGAEGDNNSRHPVITPDGRFVLFPSHAQNLTPLVQKSGPEFDNCSLEMCTSGMIYAYETATGRLALAEVGFDHTTPCCYGDAARLIAVSGRYLAFSSANAQLVASGDGDVRRVFRTEIPLWTP